MSTRTLLDRTPPNSALLWLSRADWVGVAMMRIAIASVFVWIGGVKFCSEAGNQRRDRQVPSDGWLGSERPFQGVTARIDLA